MSQKISFLFLFIMWFTIACQSSTGEQGKSGSSQQLQSDVPQMRKIPISAKAEADSLIQLGIDVIVVEDAYVVARLNQSDVAKIQSANLKTEPIQETDLIQRLVKIPVNDRSKVSELADLGMDIWEVKEDTVIAQVFDKHIREAEAKGFKVEIVARNVLDVVKKESEK
jgi:hypothetical protein